MNIPRFNKLAIIFLAIIASIIYKNKLFSLIYSFSGLRSFKTKTVLYSNKCNSLDNSIRNYLKNDIRNWSINVIEPNNNKSIFINENRPRIPASNQKLLSTAYSLDQLGPEFYLYTKLTRDIKGIFHLQGSGDPDLGETDYEKIIKEIKDRHLFRNIFQNSKIPTIYIYEEDRNLWWPSGWHKADRLENYGAPITRFAVESNTNYQSIHQPLLTIINKLYDISSIYKFNINIKPQNTLYYRKNIFNKEIFRIRSAPMSSLLSLSNSESHNYTAEVLLRSASKNWNNKKALEKLALWLRNNDVPLNKFDFEDGSGLSRGNKVTSNGLSYLLHKMKSHRYFVNYISSMSVLGVRGTLAYFPADYSLKGRFFGKSGTLTGVRAISGYLREKDKLRVLSILTNNVEDADSKISYILTLIDKNSCN